jgi:hypothetical protein
MNKYELTVEDNQEEPLYIYVETESRESQADTSSSSTLDNFLESD